MILNHEERTIQTNINSVEKEFTIKTTAKAFKILSSGLYSDKIKAIIRELSCNAWDAHVMAKNDKPFHVHLPNELEPWFAVRDYGIGLSEEDVMNLYSTYFESTKTNSNKQIGALGLGSKSPFSYTDSFNVTSIFDGKSTTYTAYINELGTPAIVKVHEEDSDEHNGLEVKFAVKEDDFREFVQKAGVVFRVFKTKPEVGGNTRYKDYEQTLTEIISGKGWSFNKTDFYASDRAVALQGNIEYPIDINQLGDLTDEQSFVANNKFYIDFKIGELDISASRESLGYDEPTVANIKRELARVYNSFIHILNKRIKEEPTLWKAYINAYTVAKEVGLSYSYWGGSKLFFNWGKKTFELGKPLEYVLSNTPKVDTEGAKIPNSGIVDRELSILHLRRERQHRSDRVSIIATIEAKDCSESIFSIIPEDEKSIFLVRDEFDEGMTDHKIRRKARQLARQNRGVNIFLVNKMNDKFFDTIGNPDYELTSSIELEKPVRVNGKPKYPDNYFHFDKQDYGVYLRNCSYGDLDEKTSVKKNYYVASLRDKLLDESGNEYQKYDLFQLFNFLKKKGLISKNSQLFAVKNAELNYKRWNTLKWKPLVETGKALLTEYIEKHADEMREPLIAKKAYTQIENEINYYLREKFIDEYENLEDYTEDSHFARIIKIFKEMYDKRNDKETEIVAISDLVRIASNFNVKIEQNYDINMDEFDYKKMYPMINFMSDWKILENFEKVKAYIIMVDNMNANSNKEEE